LPKIKKVVVALIHPVRKEANAVSALNLIGEIENYPAAYSPQK